MLATWHLLCNWTQRCIQESGISSVRPLPGTHSPSRSLARGRQLQDGCLASKQRRFSVTAAPVAMFHSILLRNIYRDKQQQRCQEIKPNLEQLGAGVIRHLRGHLGDLPLLFVHVLFQCRRAEPEVSTTRSHRAEGVVWGDRSCWVVR